MAPDPITLELYRHRYSGISEEMGITLQRTSYSPNIKERLDFSCALFDGSGRLVAQAAHIPAHLGAMPDSVAAALAVFDHWQPGDVVVLNDPYFGGSHLPDITLVSPVFLNEPQEEYQAVHNENGAASEAFYSSPFAPHFFAASRAHHADVGGMSPGSLPLSTELYQEGIIIPPLKLYEGGGLVESLLELILRNVRTPDERRGDLAAQRAAHAVGDRRLHELAARHGGAELLAYAGHLQQYSERLTRAAIRTWPDGSYTFEDPIESVVDGQTTPAPIRVTATISGETVTLDFNGTCPSIFGSLNAPLSVTRSACYYVVRCLVGEDVPVNAGCFAPVQVDAPAGCLVNARPPAAVAGGNVETSQRITDAVFGALAQALPDRIAAAGQGTMNNCTMGGENADGSPWTYYETLGGGMGAHPQGDGFSGAHVHMSNTLNTPVEALEMAYPLRLTRYHLRRGSGGAGTHQGGDGIVREYEILRPTTATILSERRAIAPWGLAGGDPAAPGRNLLIDTDGSEEELSSKVTRRMQPGQRLRIETPGGGGWGAKTSAGNSGK
ncbi:MAG: hydantoinase B/oxoprolinase family protein [Caldilineaceae bacterium SB0670_bin_27]|uniref:Hydantoinase B/oxoprolinase family protein n=1 Tax=Caldilineaceae bacterium SB0664_bin_27 TaxID=2605260 RepID=A0A6B0YXB6_9CHLR|nr:hydantoinase B/oxoprolinase family protein [Caldilineaceae bacterium SB0664_bin_27]MYJ77961.1 hydantoinase B/oxoprolinase family protein [Caldilineaceae bacterium SB0670_bin_27]